MQPILWINSRKSYLDKNNLTKESLDYKIKLRDIIKK